MHLSITERVRITLLAQCSAFFKISIFLSSTVYNIGEVVLNNYAAAVDSADNAMIITLARVVCGIGEARVTYYNGLIIGEPG